MILEWLTKHRRWVIAGCVIVIGFTILVEVFSSYCWASSIREYFQHWSLALGAGATLTLAYIAYISILENRRIRLDDIDREHKRRALQYVLDWARESYKLFYDVQKFYGPEQIAEREELEKSLTLLWAEKDAIIVAANDVDVKLSKLVALVRNELDSYWKNKGSWKPEAIKNKETNLEALFATLFKKASETKTRLRL